MALALKLQRRRLIEIKPRVVNDRAATPNLIQHCELEKERSLSMSNLVDENPPPSSSYDDENGAVSSVPRPLSPPSPPSSSAPSPSTAFFPTKAVPTRSKPTLHKRYSLVMSTEDNHAADDMVFLGDYREVRSILDYTYHRNYTPERQRLQDNIIRDMLDQSKIVDVHGQICTTPTQPWVVFTAGAMGAGKVRG